MSESINSYKSVGDPLTPNIERSYLDMKPSVVRWAPSLPDAFLVGSYGESENAIKLCTVSSIDCTEKSHATMKSDGDITSVQFLQSNPDSALVSTGSGDMFLLKITESNGSPGMTQTHSWSCDELICESEGFPCFDSDNNSVAVVTDSGKIVCFQLSLASESTIIDPGRDSIKCVSFLRSNELVAGNLRGQISIYDIREDLFRPSLTFPFNSSGSSVGVTSVAPFPHQRHLLTASSTDGSLSTWDLRSLQSSMLGPSQTILAAHKSCVTALTFHPVRPNNLFTSSMSGDVWHWTNFNDIVVASVQSVREPNPNVICLLPEKKFPVNSVDVIDDKLIFASDNDSLGFIRPLRLK